MDTREPTYIEEALDLRKYHPDAIYLSQEELANRFNALSSEQKLKSHQLEGEAEARGDYWFVNGWFGVYDADGKLILSDILQDPHWPEMYSACKETLESEGRQDVLDAFAKLNASQQKT